MGALGVVLTLSGAGVGFPVPPQSLKAPFSPVGNISTTSHVQRGCSKLHFAPHGFNNSSGIDSFDGTAKARTCGARAGGAAVTTESAVNEQTALAFALPSLPTGAPPTPVSIRVNVTLLASARYFAAIHGACPAAHRNSTSHGLVHSDCTASSEIHLGVLAQVANLSSPVLVQPNNTVPGYSESTTIYADDNCYSYGCWWSNYSYTYSLGSLRGNFSWFFNTTLAGGDHYLLNIETVATVQAEIQGFPHSRILAGLDFATKGRSWRLTSIQVT